MGVTLQFTRYLIFGSLLCCFGTQHLFWLLPVSEDWASPTAIFFHSQKSPAIQWTLKIVTLTITLVMILQLPRLWILEPDISKFESQSSQLPLGSGSQPGVILSLRGYWALSGDTLGCHNVGKEPLASNWQRPGMLLSNPQCIRQSSQQDIIQSPM